MASCPNCGELVGSGSLACPVCGAKFKRRNGAALPPAPDRAIEEVPAPVVPKRLTAYQWFRWWILAIVLNAFIEVVASNYGHDLGLPVRLNMWVTTNALWFRWLFAL